jgi:hypothetical protein
VCRLDEDVPATLVQRHERAHHSASTHECQTEILENDHCLHKYIGIIRILLLAASLPGTRLTRRLRGELRCALTHWPEPACGRTDQGGKTSGAIRRYTGGQHVVANWAMCQVTNHAFRMQGRRTASVATVADSGPRS